MKKLFALFLALILLPIAALADLPDVASMTDQELKGLITACSQELRTRATSDPEGILVFEYEGVRVYQYGEVYMAANYLYVPVVVYNDMDHEMVISPDGIICNGWDISAGNCRASGHAKKKNELIFFTDDAEVTSVDEIVSLTFKWHVYDFDARKMVFEQEEAEEHRFW